MKKRTPSIITVDWGESRETFPLDLSRTSSKAVEGTSEEWWDDIQRSVSYKTLITLKKLATGALDIIIEYRRRDNKSLHRLGIPFGSSRIRMKPGQSFGRAKWTDEQGGKDYRSAPWHLFVTNPERSVRIATRVQREQQRFRHALLRDVKACELTGETEEATLEAAHIVAVQSGGSDTSSNGLLLRADIHLLYDVGLFSISLDGSVNLMPSYRELIKSCCMENVCHQKQWPGFAWH